jgi:hypothetical protein
VLATRADLEKLIFERCPRCAEGDRPAACRNRDGSLVWVHSTAGKAAEECRAGGFQPYLAIWRRQGEAVFTSP